MKLVRYFDGGTHPKPGVVTEDGVVDLEPLIAHEDRGCFEQVLERANSESTPSIESIVEETDPQDIDSIHLLPPIGERGRLFCLGAVYTGHMQDAGLNLRFDPNQWLMPENAIIGPEEPILLPERVVDHVMPAAELCIVIGKRGRYINPTSAYNHVVGYTISNDVTARTEWPGPMAYKMLDTFAPIGPHVTTADEVARPMNLDIKMRLDGHVICEGSTAGMRFSLSFLVSYLSTITELKPGDVISAGDPGGVQEGLRPGSTVEIDIEDVGTLSNDVKLEG